MKRPSDDKIISKLDLRISTHPSSEDPAHAELQIMPIAGDLDLYTVPVHVQMNTARWGEILDQVDDALGSDDWQIEPSVLEKVFGFTFAGGGSDAEQQYDELRGQIEGVVIDYIHDQIKQILEAPRPDLSTNVEAFDLDSLDEFWATGRLEP